MSLSHNITHDKIKSVLRESYGEFNSYLEHEYESKIVEILLNENNTLNDKKEWLTYTQIMVELKNNLKNKLKVQELQYKLTENDNPTKNCIEVIKEVKTQSIELERLYNKLLNF